MAEDSGFTFNLVRSPDFLVQLESGGGGASLAEFVAGIWLPCKIHDKSHSYELDLLSARQQNQMLADNALKPALVLDNI
jgi:hypothetical protein